MMDIAALRHVLAGRQVDGSPSPFDPFPDTYSDGQLTLLAAFVVITLHDIANTYTRFSAEVQASPSFKTAICHFFLMRAAIRPATTAREFLRLFRLNWHANIIRVCERCTTLRDLQQFARETRALRRDARNGVPRLQPQTLTFVPDGPLPPHRPRPVLWRSPCGAYALTELTHPLHLMAEGRALNHCIHRTDHPFAEIRPTRSITRYASRLHYWELVKRKHARLFSFTRHDKPLVTLEVMIIASPSRLIMIGGQKNHRPNGTEPYFDALVEGIKALWQLFDSLTFDAPCPALFNALLPLAMPPDKVHGLHHPFKLPAPADV